MFVETSIQVQCRRTAGKAGFRIEQLQTGTFRTWLLLARTSGVQARKVTSFKRFLLEG